MEDRRDSLVTQMIQLNNSVEEHKRKYFHLKTIENLIFHFDDIRSESDKKWVYETLDEYFQKCSNLSTSIDRRISKKLFFEFLDKVTDYYHSNLGFSILINRTVVYFIYVLLLILCHYFFAFYVLLSVAGLFAFQIFISFRKFKQKKVYGLFY